MTSQRSTLTRLTALGGAATLVVSGATGVANAQEESGLGSLTAASLGISESMTGSVSDSLEDAPTAPTSITDLVGDVTGSIVANTAEGAGSVSGSLSDILEAGGSIEIVNDRPVPGIDGSVGELLMLVPGSVNAVAGSAALPPQPTDAGSSIPVVGSIGQFLTQSIAGSMTRPTVLASLMDMGEDGSMTDILAGVGSLEADPAGSLAPMLPYAPAGSLSLLIDGMGAGSVADATNSGLGLLAGSLGVDGGSLTGLLPVLSVAGLVAGGVALAGGVQLPPLPPLPAGSEIPAPFAPANQEG